MYLSLFSLFSFTLSFFLSRLSLNSFVDFYLFFYLVISRDPSLFFLFPFFSSLFYFPWRILFPNFIPPCPFLSTSFSFTFNVSFFRSTLFFPPGLPTSPPSLLFPSFPQDLLFSGSFPELPLFVTTSASSPPFLYASSSFGLNLTPPLSSFVLLPSVHRSSFPPLLFPHL